MPLPNRMQPYVNKAETSLQSIIRYALDAQGALHKYNIIDCQTAMDKLESALKETKEQVAIIWKEL